MCAPRPRHRRRANRTRTSRATTAGRGPRAHRERTTPPTGCACGGRRGCRRRRHRPHRPRRTRPRAQPLLGQRETLRAERDRLHDHLTNALPLARRLNRTHQTLTEAQHLVAALDTWHDWATGEDVAPANLIKTARVLGTIDAHHAALAEPLTDWIERHHVAPERSLRPQHHFHHPEPRLEPPGLDIDM